MEYFLIFLSSALSRYSLLKRRNFLGMGFFKKKKKRKHCFRTNLPVQHQNKIPPALALSKPSRTLADSWISREKLDAHLFFYLL